MATEEKYGLNKARRLQREREDREAAAQPLPLEPDFPYQVQPFDPFFFDARSEWDLSES